MMRIALLVLGSMIAFLPPALAQQSSAPPA